MSDRQASLLTDRQREYLQGETPPSNESQMRSRIRERVYHGLRDGSILFDELPTKDRKKIFRQWEHERDDEIRDDVVSETGHTTEMTPLLKGDFNIRLSNLIALIYLGSEETAIDDFESLVESAVQKAAKEKGKYISEFNLEIEFTQQSRGEMVFEALKEDEVDFDELKTNQLGDLVDSDTVDWRDLPDEKRKKVVEFIETMQSFSEMDIDFEKMVKLYNR